MSRLKEKICIVVVLLLFGYNLIISIYNLESVLQLFILTCYNKVVTINP